MILAEFTYDFYSDKDQFLEKWGGLMEALSEQRIKYIYGLWDRIRHDWFTQAPILVDTTLGTVAINLLYDRYMALALNEIVPNVKPRWFYEGKVKYLPKWREDFEWREYTPLKRFRDTEIWEVELIASVMWITGIRFYTELGRFVITSEKREMIGIPDK